MIPPETHVRPIGNAGQAPHGWTATGTSKAASW